MQGDVQTIAFAKELADFRENYFTWPASQPNITVHIDQPLPLLRQIARWKAPSTSASITNGDSVSKGIDGAFSVDTSEAVPELTLVTQLTLSRLPTLRLQCSTWPHTISAAIYAAVINDIVVSTDVAWDTMHVLAVEEKLEHWVKETTANGKCTLDAILYTEVFHDDARNDALFMYPINALRNFALNMASTEAVVILDVDFVPSVNLTSKWQTKKGYEKLLKTLNRGYAVVVPALETRARKDWNEAIKYANGKWSLLIIAYNAFF